MSQLPSTETDSKENEINTTEIHDNEPKSDDDILDYPFKDAKCIKSPYIIIVSVSDYRKKDPSGKTDLPAAAEDGKLLHKLWTEIYGFENVECVINEINSEKIYQDNFGDFLLDQRTIINKMNKNETKIDGLLFFYSGHGNENNLIFDDDEQYSFRQIKEIFDNSQCSGLRTLPKIFFYDCCRGKIKIKAMKTKARAQPIDGTNEKKDDIEIDTVLRNKFDDLYFVYSTVKGTKSWDLEYGHLTKAIYDIFKDLNFMYNNGKGSLKLACDRIKQIVSDKSNSIQTCEIQNRLDYQIYFLPKNEKYLLDYSYKKIQNLENKLKILKNENKKIKNRLVIINIHWFTKHKMKIVYLLVLLIVVYMYRKYGKNIKIKKNLANLFFWLASLFNENN